MHTISEEIFPLIELHGTQKKCGVNDNKISLQISNFRRILKQAEFQYVQYCAKVMQTIIDEYREYRDISAIFNEILP